MRSEKGFATVLLLSLVPVLLAFGGMVLFTFSILKQDLGSMNVCRALQLEVQTKAGKVVKKILDLNPKAIRLRASEKQAQVRLTQAMMTGNPVRIAAAEGALAKVQAERVSLSAEQQTLLMSGNSLLAAGATRGLQAIAQEWNSHQKTMNGWLSSSLAMNSPQPAQVGLVADLPEVAPVYSAGADFEAKQTWIQSWTVSIQVTGVMKSFIPFSTRFQRACSTSLYEEGTKWIGKLKAVSTNTGKSLLKAWF